MLLSYDEYLGATIQFLGCFIKIELCVLNKLNSTVLFHNWI